MRHDTRCRSVHPGSCSRRRPSPTGSEPPVGGLPDFLTVVEAGRLLRIGRTSAYVLAQRWLYPDGRDGLPVVRVGRQLRVPRRALERLAGGGLTAAPERPPSAPAVESSEVSTATPADADTRTSTTPRTNDDAPTPSPLSDESDARGTQTPLFPTDR